MRRILILIGLITINVDNVYASCYRVKSAKVELVDKYGKPTGLFFGSKIDTDGRRRIYIDLLPYHNIKFQPFKKYWGVSMKTFQAYGLDKLGWGQPLWIAKSGVQKVSEALCKNIPKPPKSPFPGNRRPMPIQPPPDIAGKWECFGLLPGTRIRSFEPPHPHESDAPEYDFDEPKDNLVRGYPNDPRNPDNETYLVINYRYSDDKLAERYHEDSLSGRTQNYYRVEKRDLCQRERNLMVPDPKHD